VTPNTNKPLDLLTSLKERAKELSCLYQVEEIVRNAELPLGDLFHKVVAAIVHGWYYPEKCQARIVYLNEVYQTEGYLDTPWTLSARIKAHSEEVGRIDVSYVEALPALEDGPFLEAEKKLIFTIADRLGQTVLHRKLIPLFHQVRDGKPNGAEKGKQDWRAALDMLRVTDQGLFVRVTHRMLNHLCYKGVEEAKKLLERVTGAPQEPTLPAQHEGRNRPSRKAGMTISGPIADQILDIAARYLSDDQIYALFHQWVAEKRVGFLVDVLEDRSSTLAEISDALARCKASDLNLADLAPSTVRAVKVSLVRRFFSRRLDVINLAKDVVSMDDLHEVTRRLILPPRSHGQLGGKSAGLFLAMQVIRCLEPQDKLLSCIRVPKTWYIASDGILDFIHHNRLEDLHEHKYRDIEQIRTSYPDLVALFKSCTFSPEVNQGMSMALDDLGDRPLIVRSSSLLEDSTGAAFSGKHKSLFLANQGTKRERLAALGDAVAEVYASMFGPDPVQYRTERGLLDFQEEMGIMIQEVVGNRVGPYVLPAFAGVAFSNNEFRWSPRIRREDGLVRLVPGLGTRAVDRLGNDYTVLVAPGAPGLRANAAVDEIIRHSPRSLDVINMDSRSIETIPVEELLRKHGAQYPRFASVFSVVDQGMLHAASPLSDFEKSYFVPAFEGLISGTQFIPQIARLMGVLQRHYDHPVDLEFAVDDRDFYLLQCRTQSSALGRVAVRPPSDVPRERVVFTASKYVSDGYLPEVTHVVYVVPDAYDRLEKESELRDVGRVIGALNRLLPKRGFILMGPGRWGSRGDIKLGVSVTYSDINNTAALIEVAFRKGNYVPDLSFGTHFFQDLVEASIHYLPLYPDDTDAVFNHEFFLSSRNLLPTLIPEASHLQEVIRVIDVPASHEGLVMRLVMSGDQGKAMAFLAPSSRPPEKIESPAEQECRTSANEEHWRWRMRAAEKISRSADPVRFGIKGMYVFGSTKNANAGPCSDLDLLVHFDGNEDQRRQLDAWLEGWGLALADENYLRTGHRVTNLLDVHVVTDQDVAERSAFAVKMGAITDAARPLPLGNAK